MKSSRYAALAAAAGLVLTGCGDDSTSGAGSSPSAPVTSTPTPTPTGQPLPLTVTRKGGFAGFDDMVVVGADGIASISKVGKDLTRCRLDAGLLASITDAARQIDWASIGVTKPTVKHPDDMIIAVAADGGLTRLEDPKVKPLVAPVSKLLTEATVPPGKLCRPV